MFVDTRGLSPRRRKWLNRSTIILAVAGVLWWGGDSLLGSDWLSSYAAVVAGLAFCVSAIALNGFRAIFGLILVCVAIFTVAHTWDDNESWRTLWFWPAVILCVTIGAVFMLYGMRGRLREIEEAEKAEK